MCHRCRRVMPENLRGHHFHVVLIDDDGGALPLSWNHLPGAAYGCIVSASFDVVQGALHHAVAVRPIPILSRRLHDTLLRVRCELLRDDLMVDHLVPHNWSLVNESCVDRHNFLHHTRLVLWDVLRHLLHVGPGYLLHDFSDLNLRNVDEALLVENLGHIHDLLAGLQGNHRNVLFNNLHLWFRHLDVADDFLGVGHFHRLFMKQGSRNLDDSLPRLQHYLGDLLLHKLSVRLRHLGYGFHVNDLRCVDCALLVDDLRHLHYFLDVLNDFLWYQFVPVLHLRLGYLFDDLAGFHLRHLHDSFLVDYLRNLDNLGHILDLDLGHLLFDDPHLLLRHLLSQFPGLHGGHLHDAFLDGGLRHLHDLLDALHHPLVHLLRDHLDLCLRHLLDHLDNFYLRHFNELLDGVGCRHLHDFLAVLYDRPSHLLVHRDRVRPRHLLHDVHWLHHLHLLQSLVRQQVRHLDCACDHLIHGQGNLLNHLMDLWLQHLPLELRSMDFGDLHDLLLIEDGGDLDDALPHRNMMGLPRSRAAHAPHGTRMAQGPGSSTAALPRRRITI
mmetsp:Transcript_65959/g.143705  ORF Transcript_65959/g.143705 Transcript_65959/m.143705 type:complete len:554 (+) Transcript_65959:26-1687(+)